MKRFFPLLLCIALALCSAGCRTDEPQVTVPTRIPVETTAPTAPTEPAPTQPPTQPHSDFQAPLYAATMPVVSSTYKAMDGTALLTYTAQDLSVLLEDPQIAEAVALDFLNLVDFSNSSAVTLLRDAREEYTGQENWQPCSYSVLYNPVRIDAGILSLYGTQLISGGNLRASSLPLSLTYDLLTGRRLALKDVLIPAYSADTLVSAICQSLSDYADSGMLYSDYAYVIGEMFSTNTPVKTWYLSPTGLCFYFVPYEIAPHSAGTIVTEIPYEALTGLLRDEYFPAELPALSGCVSVSPLDGSTLSQFRQFAELSLDRGGQELLLRTEGAVANLRIELGVLSADSNVFYPTCTVFAAATFCAGDALILEVAQENISSLRITYESDGTVVSSDLNSILS